jgi:hypothetical protein
VAEPSATAAREALQSAQGLVGEWRGVGQPKRGAAAGAWIEQAAGAWEFSAAQPSLVLTIDQGHVLRRLDLHAPAERDQEFTLRATLADGRTLDLQGRAAADGVWTFTAANPGEGQPARITWRFVAEGSRLVMLLEGRTQQRYYRIAEVGYTRKGARFAAAEGNPECIVTGGYGSMTVEYQGKTYYVCCSGCRELFESDPERVLAEYRERLAEKKAGD